MTRLLRKNSFRVTILRAMALLLVSFISVPVSADPNPFSQVLPAQDFYRLVAKPLVADGGFQFPNPGVDVSLNPCPLPPGGADANISLDLTNSGSPHYYQPNVGTTFTEINWGMNFGFAGVAYTLPVPGLGNPPLPGLGNPPLPSLGNPPLPSLGNPPLPGLGDPPLPGLGDPPLPGLGDPFNEFSFFAQGMDTNHAPKGHLFRVDFQIGGPQGLGDPAEFVSLNPCPLPPGADFPGAPFSGDSSIQNSLNLRFRFASKFGDPTLDFQLYDVTLNDVQFGFAPVPEPGTLFLLGIGLAAAFGLRKRRRVALNGA